VSSWCTSLAAPERSSTDESQLQQWLVGVGPVDKSPHPQKNGAWYHRCACINTGKYFLRTLEMRSLCYRLAASSWASGLVSPQYLTSARCTCGTSCGERRDVFHRFAAAAEMQPYGGLLTCSQACGCCCRCSLLPSPHPGLNADFLVLYG